MSFIIKNPCLIHFAGRKKYNPLFQQTLAVPVCSEQVDSSIFDIVTWNQCDNIKYCTYKNLGLFEEYCSKLGFNCHVLSDKSIKWDTNRRKILLTLEFLKFSKKEFILAADSSDVLMFDLPNANVLQDTNCDMLFNAEKLFWPHSGLDDIKKGEEEIESGFFRYLNSGLWIAKKEYAIEVFEKLSQMMDSYMEFYKSDQVLFKALYLKEYPKMKIDSKCNVFVNLSHVEKNEVILKFKSLNPKIGLL